MKKINGSNERTWKKEWLCFKQNWEDIKNSWKYIKRYESIVIKMTEKKNKKIIERYIRTYTRWMAKIKGVHRL